MTQKAKPKAKKAGKTRKKKKLTHTKVNHIRRVEKRLGDQLNSSN